MSGFYSFSSGEEMVFEDGDSSDGTPPLKSVSSPFSGSFQRYRDLGWKNVFPLPFGKKSPPPKGCIGGDAKEPSFDDCLDWADMKQANNLGVRLPETVIGLDVDHYGDKTGGDTLAKLEADLGPLPKTWRSSSREDGVSGIRFYRVPAGTRLVGGMDGIDLIQSHLRYFVASPSIHPKGGTYKWLNEATGEEADTPNIDDLPKLPETFLSTLSKPSAKAEVSSSRSKGQADIDDINATLSAMPVGRPCKHMYDAVIKSFSDGSRHDAYRNMIMAVTRAGRRGCPGAVRTLDARRAVFVAEVVEDGTRGQYESEQEWQRMVAGACELAQDEPQGTRCRSENLSIQTGGDRVVLTKASEMNVLSVRWLWNQRVPIGSLALLAGPEGLGKSTVGYWIAGRVTRGELPGDLDGTPRAVLIAATEDSWEHTIVPRLLAADADLNMVYRIEVDRGTGMLSELVLPKDNAELERVAREAQAGLLIMDPLISRVSSKIDSHKDADVRLALEPIVAIAGRTGMAVLGIMHFNKGGGSPLDSIMASKAFTAVARSVHTVIPDSDDESGETRLFGTPTSNLSTTQQALLEFKIVGCDIPTDDGSTTSTGKLEWVGQREESVDSALKRGRDGDTRSVGEEAADWLEDYLAENGGCVERKEMMEVAHADGFSEDQLKRARKHLEVVVKREGFPAKSKWMTKEYFASRGSTASTS